MYVSTKAGNALLAGWMGESFGLSSTLISIKIDRGLPKRHLLRKFILCNSAMLYEAREGRRDLNILSGFRFTT